MFVASRDVVATSAVTALFDARLAREVARDLQGAGFLTCDIAVLRPECLEDLDGSVVLSVHVETWAEQSRARLILARNGGHHVVVVE